MEGSVSCRPASFTYVGALLTNRPADAGRRRHEQRESLLRLRHRKPAKGSRKAADAVYWPTRLEPTWADAYCARRIALLLSDRRRLRMYWFGDRRTIEATDIRQIDSLF